MFMMTGVYGYNTREEIFDLWRDLRSNGNVNDLPWILWVTSILLGSILRGKVGLELIDLR